MKSPALRSQETLPITNSEGALITIKIIPLPARDNGPFIYDLFLDDIGVFYIHEPEQYGLPPNGPIGGQSSASYRGQILFDGNGYWIYDGNQIGIPEQEQIAEFILNFNGHSAMSHHKDNTLRYL